MSLQMPNLDDRTFEQLQAEALETISHDLNTSWNDFAPGDPGVILLETFSYLTEQMIYRLNLVPEKAYIAFLRMLGVGLRPPYAAQVELSFYQEPGSAATYRIPRGARIASQPPGQGAAAGQTDDREALVFTTMADLDVTPQHTQDNPARVLAYNAAWQEEDLPQPSSGQPGQIFVVAHPPIVGDSPNLKLKLGVEVGSDHIPSNDDWVTEDGRRFEVWEEVENFAGVSEDDRVFRLDRQAGIIQFAPAAALYTKPAQVVTAAQKTAAEEKAAAKLKVLAEQKAAEESKAAAALSAPSPAAATGAITIPPAATLPGTTTISNEPLSPNADKTNGHNGSQPGMVEVKALAAIPPQGRTIHIRYATGGGASGNIPAGLLTVIQEPSDLRTRVKVTNQDKASGGIDTETLDNALVRGPQEVFTQDRLITARDFERAVLRAWADIARARAIAEQEMWEHGRPGLVKINLVPLLTGDEFNSADKFTKKAFEAAQKRLDNHPAKKQTEKTLGEDGPLGISASLGWARYKRVHVAAEVKVAHGTDTGPVKERLTAMLYRALSPLPPPRTDLAAAGPASLAAGTIAQAGPGRPPAQEAANGQPAFLPEQNGWSFGAELRLAEVSRWILTSEPNIRLLSKLEVHVDSAPNQAVHALAADYFQPNTWYAASGTRLFRSINNAAGWEELLDFSPRHPNALVQVCKAAHSRLPDSEANPQARPHPGPFISKGGQTIKKICPSRYRVGLVAAVGADESVDPLRSYVYLSTDCGESWLELIDLDSEVADIDWLARGGNNFLLLATSKGLKELRVNIDSQNRITCQYTLTPIPVIDAEQDTLSVSAVKVLSDHGNNIRVAVAMDGRRGVYISDGVNLTKITVPPPPPPPPAPPQRRGLFSGLFNRPVRPAAAGSPGAAAAPIPPATPSSTAVPAAAAAPASAAAASGPEAQKPRGLLRFFAFLRPRKAAKPQPLAPATQAGAAPPTAGSTPPEPNGHTAVAPTPPASAALIQPAAGPAAEPTYRSAFTRLISVSPTFVEPDFRCIGVQWFEHENMYGLWAGAMALGPDDPGEGCCCWFFDDELTLQVKSGRWYNIGWEAGSCLGLAFVGSRVLAATARGSVLTATVKPIIRDDPSKPTSIAEVIRLTGAANLTSAANAASLAAAVGTSDLWSWDSGQNSDLPQRQVRFKELLDQARSENTKDEFTPAQSAAMAAARAEAIKAATDAANAAADAAIQASTSAGATAAVEADPEDAAVIRATAKAVALAATRNIAEEAAKAAAKAAADAASKAAVEAATKFVPFTAIASSDGRRWADAPLVMAGCDQGVFCSQDRGDTFDRVSRDTFRQMKDAVTLPKDWLLVSGTHDIRVDEETDTTRDDVTSTDGARGSGQG